MTTIALPIDANEADPFIVTTATDTALSNARSLIQEQLYGHNMGPLRNLTREALRELRRQMTVIENEQRRRRATSPMGILHP